MAGKYDLASLNSVKSWLGNTGTTGDAELARLISAASRFILSYLSRGNILLATYTDRLDSYGYGQRRFVLKRWPVVSLSAFSVGTVAVPIAQPAQPGGSLPNGALLSSWDGTPPGMYQFVDVFGCYGVPAGSQDVSVTYKAGYSIQSEPATVPANPFTLASTALEQPYGAWAQDDGVAYAADGSPLAVVASNPAEGQYSVAVDQDSLVATYTFNAADAGKAILVSYSYVPADLCQAAIELVAVRAQDKQHIGQSSKTLGGQETVAYITKDMPDAMKLYLQNYRATVPM